MHFEGGAQPEGLLCAERQRPASGREAVTNKGSCRRHEPRVKRGMTSRAGLAVAVLVATSIGLAEGFSGNLGFSLGRSRGISLVSKQGMASGLPQKAAVGCSLWAGGFGAKKAARAAGCSIVQLSSSTASFLDLVGHPLVTLPAVRSACRPPSCALSCLQHFVAPHWPLMSLLHPLLYPHKQEDDERKDYREADIMGYRSEFCRPCCPTDPERRNLTLSLTEITDSL